jgi:hypothetical protein
LTLSIEKASGSKCRVIAKPVSQFMVLFVLGVGDGLNEIVKTWDASTVFRRTCKPTVRADRIHGIRINWKLFLQDDGVFPAIAKVIGVVELGARLPNYIR